MRKRLVITATLVLLLAAGGTWLLLDSRKGFPTTASASYDSSSEAGPRPTNVGELVATATFTFEGKVLRVEQGEPVPYDDGSGDVTVPRYLVVEVGTVFHSRDPAATVPSTLLVWDGYWEDGVGYEREPIGWAQPGQSGFFFVRQGRGPDGDFRGRYTPIAEGLALIGGEEVEYGHEGVWQSLGSSASPDMFRSAISEGARAARSGEAEPVLQTICYPSVPGDENSEPICVEE
ncbi:hypothetical protein [Nocardioides sp.]|uniref:hypothetical protein n=1 Tax=Nocardioides sp. TaxID=35761 RepID=UPI002C28554A|nr:hypothetical protein [Nocardioides sp.]HXH79581.1 hypothetical protein [Nocardioides sp.]